MRRRKHVAKNDVFKTYKQNSLGERKTYSYFYGGVKASNTKTNGENKERRYGDVQKKNVRFCDTLWKYKTFMRRSVCRKEDVIHFQGSSE